MVCLGVLKILQSLKDCLHGKVCIQERIRTNIHGEILTFFPLPCRGGSPRVYLRVFFGDIARSKRGLVYLGVLKILRSNKDRLHGKVCIQERIRTNIYGEILTFFLSVALHGR